MMSLRSRLVLVILAGATFLIAIVVQAWMSENTSRRLVQEQLTEELKDQVNLLLEQRSELDAAHQRELALVHEWLDKVAVPRETILRNAMQDAANWYQTDLDACGAHATLGKDGWKVRCGLKAEMFPSPPGIDYLLDPLTGKILSKRIDE